MRKHPLLNATDQSIEHHDNVPGNGCHYLQQIHPVDVATPSATSAVDATQQHGCYAVPTMFVPSTVHQSSCCLNPANFVRCPYYVEAMGQQKKQIDFHTRKRSISSRLGHQLARLFPFGRNARKRRNRIYFFR